MKIFGHLLKAISLLGGVPKGVKLSPNLKDNWTLDADFILDNTQLYGDNEKVGRFAYHPKTRELVWGPLNQMHADFIRNQSSSPFDEFVRGVYTPSGKIMLRWYNISNDDPDEIKAKSFDAWQDTLDMLKRNGLPPGVTVEFAVKTEDIQQEIGRFYK